MTSRLTSGALVVAATATLLAQHAVPPSPLTAQSYAALEKRCGTPTAASAASIATLRRARWVPFLHLDREIARNDIEVIGGMTEATPGCEATSFNLFVFAGGRFAGVVSTAAMTPARDGVAGAVRITGADTITVEFARYKTDDLACCPSSRERVSYRIDTAGSGPALVTTDTRQLR